VVRRTSSVAGSVKGDRSVGENGKDVIRIAPLRASPTTLKKTELSKFLNLSRGKKIPHVLQ
jgi:hypothetical protein